MARDPHDLSHEASVGTGNDGITTRELVSLEHTWRLAMVEPAAAPAFERAVYNYVIAARRRGDPIERIVASLKRELAMLTPKGDGRRAGELMEFAVRACIEEYYRPSP